jgi:hypothetical protein
MLTTAVVSQTDQCRPTFRAHPGSPVITEAGQCANLWQTNQSSAYWVDKDDDWEVSFKNPPGADIRANVTNSGEGVCFLRNFDLTPHQQSNLIRCYSTHYVPGTTTTNVFFQDIASGIKVGVNPASCGQGLTVTHVSTGSDYSATCPACPSGQFNPHRVCDEFTYYCKQVNSCGQNTCENGVPCDGFQCGSCTLGGQTYCDSPPVECPQGYYYLCDQSSLQCVKYSPIVIDVNGNGFNLTDGPSGVVFDLNGTNHRRLVAWTSTNSDDGWLALDRDNSGEIESGAELFGNATPQPNPPPGQLRNGFLALAEYDKLEAGGTGTVR